MHVVRHEVPFYYLDPLVAAKLAEYPPRESRYWLQVIFRLYFGADTMWYLHIHFECDRLLAWFAMMAAFPGDTSQASVSYPIGRRPSSRKGEAFDAHPHSGCFISRRAARAGQAREPYQPDTPAPNGLKSIAQNLKDGFSQVSGCSLLAPRLLNHFRNNRGNLQEE